MQELSFQRFFQIWNYTASHAQLLVRSNKDSENDTRIDILFKNVSIVHIPTALKNINITQGEPDREHRDFDPELIKGRYIFTVHCEGFSGYVVAGAMYFHEDSGTYRDPSFFDTL